MHDDELESPAKARSAEPRLEQPAGGSPERATAEELPLEAFEQAAEETLDALLEAVLEASETIDADLESGVLTIAFDDDGPRYVINSHRAARQIWMAAERAAWHFDYDASTGHWAASQTGDQLWPTVRAVLARRLGKDVALPEPS